MTGVLVALLAIMWALVLVPPLVRTRENAHLAGKVGTYNKELRALASGPAPSFGGGRYVLTPKRFDEPNSRMVMYRRRRMFSALVSALMMSLVMGAIPGLRSFWWLSLIIAIAAGGYAAFLVSEKNRGAHRTAFGSAGRPQARPQAPLQPVPNRGFFTDSIINPEDGHRHPIRKAYDGDETPHVVATRPSALFQLFDEEDRATEPSRAAATPLFPAFEEDEADDGLSELGWAHAGHL